MKKISLLLLGCIASLLSFSQVVIRTDSVIISNSIGNTFLKGNTFLENVTQGTVGDSILVRGQNGIVKFLPGSGLTMGGNVVLKNLGTPAADLTTIETWGDSFTEAQGFTPYTSTLASLSGLTVNNNGAGGETSGQIKARLLSASTAKRARPTIIWAGFNDFPNMTSAVNNIADMVASLGHQSYIVIGVTMSTDGGFESGLAGWIAKKKFNDDLGKIYKQNFFDVHNFLMTKYDPANSTDLVNVIDDITPSSLRSDNLHLNSAGYALVGAELYSRLKILDIVTSPLSANVIYDQSLSPLHVGRVKKDAGYFSYLESDNLNISKDGFLRQDGLPVFRTFRNSVFIGYEAGKNVRTNTGTTSTYNTMVGFQSGLNATGTVNTLIGFQAATNLTTGGNNIAIGNGIDIANPEGFNQLNIGNLIYGTGLTGTGSTISGRIGIGINNTNVDSRLEVNGLANYTSDVSSQFTDRSFIDKGYADNRYLSHTSGGTLGGELILDGTNGQRISLKTSGANTTFIGSSNAIFETGSTTDFTTYVFGDNAYTLYTNGYKRLQVEGQGPGTAEVSFFGKVSVTDGTSGGQVGTIDGNDARYVSKVSTTDVEISDATKGVILKSPNGSRWRLTIDDTGNLTVNAL